MVPEHLDELSEPPENFTAISHELPANFKFTTNDPFYFGPSTCHLLHYTTAAYIAGIIETFAGFPTLRRFILHMNRLECCNDIEKEF
ncbi:hypothetical protein DICVIV_08946 [Dictyocaulus viviparus]|uniref:Uncharacterized protein n=1 Tax=Dictyocaulus viviparus TaxID=29172 RepID=A0A0D8XKC0_DICVI|nr:hypothetical protein DICVIV_08946 [Dictyocaulus viviparus]